MVGVPCATCVLPIRRTLERTPGIKTVGANYVADLILVDYDPIIIDENRILAVIRSTGYRAVPQHR